MADHCCNHEHKDKCAPPPLVLPQKTGAVQHQADDACCSAGVPVFDGVRSSLQASAVDCYRDQRCDVRD